MNHHFLRRIGAASAIVAAAGMVVGLGASTASAGQRAPSLKPQTASSKIVIGWTRASIDNPWQVANTTSALDAINVLKSEHAISGYDFLNADNNVSTQISQIDDLILKHVSVILIDPTSASGLNGAIAKAKQAGIPVLVFSDGPVTSTLPYELEFAHEPGQAAESQYIAQRLHCKGNVIIVRGAAGTASDEAFYQGEIGPLKACNGGIKVVATVYGDWESSVTQSAIAQILPTLPSVQAVINEGAGEEYGAIQALTAAGRPAPLTVGANDGAFLSWWAKENKKNGYTTVSTTPDAGIGAAAVYVGYDIAKGEKVPKSMAFPWMLIQQSALAKYASLPFDGEAYEVFSQQWTQQNVVDKTPLLFISGTTQSNSL